MQNASDRLSRAASALVAFWRGLGPLWTRPGIGAHAAESNRIARAYGYADADAVRREIRDRMTPRVAWAWGF